MVAGAPARLSPELLPERLPYGGHHCWLRLPDGRDVRELTSAALRAGVAVPPGHAYFIAEPPAPHLRVGYACAEGPARPVEGIERLHRALISTDRSGPRPN
ncbi:hypothetical protein ACIRL2_08635 [Embleya sp. NPDC127516]|uniref:hypothetical protein n=1 Tax=Embleya sp. NPDC127516 TaxID=3363990 RepID=UPI0037F48E04